MKNHFIATLLIFCMSITVAMAQTKKPKTKTKKPTTTVKSPALKTTTTKKTYATTTINKPVAKPIVKQKTTRTISNTTTPTQGTTTTIQSSEPSKGKNASEPKLENVRESNESKPERVRVPRERYGSLGGIKFGIRAEASQIVTFEEGVNFLFSPGFNAGLIINIPISARLAVQPEVLYSTQMVKVDGVLLGGANGDYLKVTGSSILTPVTLSINLGQNSTKFIISLGGYADYALTSESQKSDGRIKTSMSADLANTDRFSYGAVGGVGVKLNDIFLIEARSFYDLKNSDNKTIGLTLGIGYLF